MDGCTDVLASTLTACLLFSLLSSRETGGVRHLQRWASKGLRLTTVFADHRVYTSTPNHTAVNQCGVAECKQTPLVSSWERRRLHIPGMCASLHVHSCMLLYSHGWGSLHLWVDCHTGSSICYPAVVCRVITICTQLIRESTDGMSSWKRRKEKGQLFHWLVCFLIFPRGFRLG